MVTVSFIVAELAFLAAAHRFGGPPWTVVGAVAVLALMAGGGRLVSLATAAPSLAWLAIYSHTGNRELFFPYAMYLAGSSAVAVPGRAGWMGVGGGVLVVATFLLIRILQNATPKVLAVEGAVAAGILALTLLARDRPPRHVPPPVWQVAIAAAASLLAYAGLAL